MRSTVCSPPSASQLVLAAYRRWGEAYVEHIEGPVATCVMDTDRDALMEYFIWLDETHDASFYGEMARLSDFLSQYWNKRSLLVSGVMSAEAFREWKLHWEHKE